MVATLSIERKQRMQSGWQSCGRDSLAVNIIVIRIIVSSQLPGWPRRIIVAGSCMSCRWWTWFEREGPYAGKVMLNLFLAQLGSLEVEVGVWLVCPGLLGVVGVVGGRRGRSSSSPAQHIPALAWVSRSQHGGVTLLPSHPLTLHITPGQSQDESLRVPNIWRRSPPSWICNTIDQNFVGCLCYDHHHIPVSLSLSLSGKTIAINQS